MNRSFMIVGLLCFGSLFAQSYDQQMIEQLGTLEPVISQALYDVAIDTQNVKPGKSLRDHVLLYDRYPALQKTVAHVTCGQLPTPVTRAERLERALDVGKLYVKNDGLMKTVMEAGNQLVGGNKVRKLEFLLADALEQGARKIMTFGALGSNHVAATATCAHMFGLQVHAMLVRQPVTDLVKQNVALDLLYGARLDLWSSRPVRTMGTVTQMIQDKAHTGMFPYVIPIGGSNALGALGYVNAAFELQEQIQAGMLEEPDFIYVPVGSGGTTAGLLLGCKLAGLRSTVVAVAVEPEEQPGECVAMIRDVYESANRLLHEHDATIPLHDFQTCNLRVNLANTGPEYGIDTEFGHMMRTQFYEYEGFILEPTYTSKAAAALYRDAERLKDKTVLFWLTFNQAHIADAVADKQLKYPHLIAQVLEMQNNI